MTEQLRLQYCSYFDGKRSDRWRNWSSKKYSSVRRALQALNGIRSYSEPWQVIINGNPKTLEFRFRVVHYYQS